MLGDGGGVERLPLILEIVRHEEERIGQPLRCFSSLLAW